MVVINEKSVFPLEWLLTSIAYIRSVKDPFQVQTSSASFITLRCYFLPPPADVDLIAPNGIIDAGDAGIRVSGNINIAAVQVLNASNITVGGKSTGVPTVTQQSILDDANHTGSSTNAPIASSSDSIAALTLLQEADQLASQGKLDEAIAKVSSVIESDPKNVLAYNLRGNFYAKKKLWDQAENDFKAILQIDPADVAAKLDLAEIAFIQGKYDQARTDYADLQTDQTYGDYATFEFFLCDLAAGQEDVAASRLDHLELRRVPKPISRALLKWLPPEEFGFCHFTSSLRALRNLSFSQINQPSRSFLPS